MRFINLTTLDDSYQAHFVKKALEDEGIRCIVANEHSSNLLQIAGPLANVIQVRVLEEDFEAASNILNKLKADTDAIVCPNCGSKNVELGFGFKNRFKRIVMILLSFALIIPTGKLNLVYQCTECNTEFQKNKF